MSYRFISSLPGETRPVRMDSAYRIQWKGWGAYGYWDINPIKAEVFEEDLPFHEEKPGQRFGTKVYGKTFGFRDGHAAFHTYIAHGINKLRWDIKRDGTRAREIAPASCHPERKRRVPASLSGIPRPWLGMTQGAASGDGQ